ncbi:sulfurtransferase [Bacillus sp. JJ1764]|uniref:sulfurtransferase n=1 Tax=Bacillus sp. JJ1764 TaxID=3122964 RepID=UPI002FFD7A43
MSFLKYILDREWLLDHLHDRQVRIVDCRFTLTDPEKGRQDYLTGHLPGASYFDLEKDLSSPVGLHGGRHPLPNLDQLVKKLEQSGINEDSTVVVYDNGEEAFAGRFWWMLQYLGHEKVYVLNGGFKQWVLADLPVTTDIPLHEPAHFKYQVKPGILAQYSEVQDVVSGAKSDVVLIDSREEKRYLGLEEPIDKKAGHIPSAINKPWMEGLEDGYYKPAGEQHERFSELSSDQQIIVYCGSGVTATPNYLALKEAGFKNVKLYVGSFSDWISYDGNKID